MNQFLLNFISGEFKKPGKALDLGAGLSFDVACLKLLGWKCEGVDKKTGTDLEKLYISKKSPFDLVFSDYVLHFIKNKESLIQSAYENLKPGGLFFLHTFDYSDKIIKPRFKQEDIKKLMEEVGFNDLKSKIITFYDNEPNHKHWHKILQITAKK